MKHTKKIMKTIESKQGTLQGRDYLKGIGIGSATAVIVAIFSILQQWIADGNDIFDFEWKSLVSAALAGLIAYLGKNIIEPSKVGVITDKGKAARKIITARNRDGNPPPVGDPTHPKG